MDETGQSNSITRMSAGSRELVSAWCHNSNFNVRTIALISLTRGFVRGSWPRRRLGKRASSGLPALSSSSFVSWKWAKLAVFTQGCGELGVEAGG